MKSTPSNLSNCKIWRKNEKDQNLRQKILYWVFLTKMPYLGILGQELKKKKKIIVKFEISTLQFVYLQNFAKKQICLNLVPKMPYLGIFGLEFLKTILIFQTSILKFIKKGVHKSYSDFWYRICFF